MREIVVKTQVEIDAIPQDFSGEILITGGTQKNPIFVSPAWGSATVNAWDSATVHAWDSATVHAWDSATVNASGSATVRAWGNAKVHAWDSATVHAWDSAKVHAWDSATVHAWDSAKVTLVGFAVALLLHATAKAVKKSKTATIIQPKTATTTAAWLAEEGLAATRGRVILFKKVSKNFKTTNNTTWTIGETLTHDAYDPREQECGAGKFHACSAPYFCDEFRNELGDRYLAIEVAIEDLYVWPQRSYQHKIAFRRGTVLYECHSITGAEVKP